ncbi:MAG: ammonia-forming cytochrome c nitrite reductase [Leptospirales bacterium]|nr:ammonia-forming cytochrome c nitrite reductase [Leptospirales bacterium]
MIEQLTEKIKNKPAVGWAIVAAVMVVVFLLGLLASSITGRRAEKAALFYNKKVEITGIESRNEIWGENYPREYKTWKKTLDMDFRSKHMGTAVEDLLEKRPKMIVLWAGYAFAQDYMAPRGHMYAVDDVRASLRTGSPDENTKDMQSASCWVCKTTDVPRMMNETGIADFYKTPWSAMGDQMANPIGCVDCHDPKTMSLTITRPSLVEAFGRQKRNIADATQQEMRSLVCAQCHVEYYFDKGDGKYITLPWDDGITVEDMEKYYDNANFKDWTHAVSRAPMLKAQHPDYELFLLGPHAQRGLSCADCHMPYVSEGGIKYSNHQMTSPLKNISNTCQVCHRDSEETLRNYVYQYQDKALEIRDRIETELSKAHIMAKTAWDKGASETEMAPVMKLLRQAQWRWDYVVASHGGTFHAPVESQRILAHSLDKTLLAQLELQKILFARGIKDVPMPDISTKEKAQAYVGLDIKTIRDKKTKWVKDVVPKWIQTAKENKRLLGKQ